MKSYKNIHDTLSFFKLNCDAPYYISSGKPLNSLPIDPFRIDYYMISICRSGCVDLIIDNQEVTISKNEILMAAPSTIIQFVKISDDFLMKLLFFDKNFLLKNVSDSFIIERFAFFKQNSFNIFNSDEEKNGKILHLLDYLDEKSKKESVFKEEIIRTIIFNILLETGELLYQSKTTITNQFQETKELYFKFIKLLKEKITEQRDVKFYAATLCISNKYLIQITKKAADKTPHQIIDEMLVKEAYFMLNNPTYNISEIAFQLNFSSTASFSRFFKQNTGFRPNDFKEKNLR